MFKSPLVAGRRLDDALPPLYPRTLLLVTLLLERVQMQLGAVHVADLYSNSHGSGFDNIITRLAPGSSIGVPLVPTHSPVFSHERMRARW